MDCSANVFSSLSLGAWGDLSSFVVSDPALAKIEIVGEVVKGKSLILETSATDDFRVLSSSAMLDESEEFVTAENN